MNMKENAETIIQKAAVEAKNLISAAAIEAAKILKDASAHVVNIEVIANDMAYLRKDVTEIKGKLESHYVTQDTFVPIQRIVYGLISVLGLGVIGAIFKMIFI